MFAFKRYILISNIIPYNVMVNGLAWAILLQFLKEFRC